MSTTALLAIMSTCSLGALMIEVHHRLRIKYLMDLNVAELGIGHKPVDANDQARHAANENSKQANLYGHFAPPVMGE